MEEKAEQAQHLVQLGADIAARDKQRLSALHFAAAHGHLDLVSFLWSKGVELDWESPDGRSPLHLAALKGHSSVVHFLLSKQAWADAQDAQDNTPLHLAARGKSLQTVSELLKVAASTTMTNKLALTPLAEALVSGRTKNAQLLVEKDPSGLSHRAKGWSLLHLAASTGQPSSVAMLIKHGADIHDKEAGSGLTPLHAAAMSGNVTCVNLLLEANASISTASSDGSFPSALVPSDHPDKAQLLALLKSSSSSAISEQKKKSSDNPVVSIQPSTVTGPPQVQAFKALSKEAQLSRVERWAESGPEDPQVAGELKGFWSEVKKRLAEAHKTLMVLALHKVLMMLHEDEDYQRDVGDAQAMDAILNDVKQHPEKLQKYSLDPAKQNVFKKMELFTMVLKATDQRGKVPWQETLIPPDNSNWQEQDKHRKQGLMMMLETQKEAAVAAALAGSEEEAAKIADAAEGASKHSLVQSQRPATAATATSGPSDSGTPAASSTSSRGAAIAASIPGGRNAQSTGSPQKPPSGLRSRKGQQHGQSKGKVNEGQTGAIAAAADPSDAVHEDELPPVMSWKEALHQLRFQIIGYGILLLGFWAWLLWMDYTHDDRLRDLSARPEIDSFPQT
ncbi:MAG: hypothetical protein FRX49_07539 [Trebouxia sp. A1-2]|nr:MAG: hypothetical protein FRX49_07539 [Trebouxia sp. A1-2]